MEFFCNFVGGAKRIHLIVLQALWCLTHGIRLLMLVEPCHRTKAEVFIIIIIKFITAFNYESL